MQSKGCTRAAVWCFALLLVVQSARAQQRPRLDIPALNAQGVLQLAVHGDPGASYALEISKNLNSWFPLFSRASASNGLANFDYSPGTNANTRALFFRARPEIELPPVKVSVGVDANQQTVTLITPDEGGALSLTDARGVGWTLMVPPRAVVESQVVTLTVATNLAGVPFAAGPMSAITLSPDNLRFSEAAQLIIQFPRFPPTDMRRVVAYAFDLDGGYLRLVPSLTFSNSMILPLAGLSAFGCSIATLDEILQQGQRVPGDTNVPAPGAITRNGPVTKNNFSDGCFPADNARAVFVGKSVDNALRIANQNAAEKIAAASQSDDAPSLGDLGLADDVINFYRDHLDQYAEEVKSNCALAQTLIPYFLGVQRQAQLLGVETGSHALDLCPTYSFCAERIGECCKLKGASEQALLELESLARGWQLLGCSTPNPEQYCPDCFPVWFGKITYLMTHNSYKVDGDVESDSQYRLEATLNAESDLVGSPLGDSYYLLSGTLSGSAQGFNKVHTRQQSRTGCDSYLDTLDSSALSAPASGNFTLAWGFTNAPPSPFVQNGLALYPDTPTIIALSSVPSLKTVTQASSSQDKDGNCTKTLTVTTSQGKATYPLVQLMYNSSSITGTVNAITGSYTTNWTGEDGSAWSTTMSWDFQRKQ